MRTIGPFRGAAPIDTPSQVAPPRTRTELFLGFLSIGARAFGGVLPWAHRTLVEERRWLTAEDFAHVLALCQFLPGPNVANCSIVLGRRWFGLSGAAAAFAGLMALPFVWVLALAALYTGYGDNALLRSIISGVGIAGAGLFIGTALKLARPIARRPVAIAIVGACFAAVGLARVPLLVALPAALAAALFAARRRWI